MPFNTWDPVTGNFYDASGNQVDENTFYAQQFQANGRAMGAIPFTDAENAAMASGHMPTSPQAGYGYYNAGAGGSMWAPIGDPRFMPAPKHNDGFFQADAYDPRALLSEMPGLTIPLVALTAGAAGGLAGGGAAGGDAALAGGGEVGSGYAASAPGLAGTEAASTSGAGSLVGSGGSDTLGTSQGNSMWDLVDNTGSFDQTGSQGVFDANGNPMYNSSVDPYGLGVDQYGNPTSQYAPSTFQGDTTNSFFNPSSSGGINYQQIAQKYGPQAAKMLQSLVAGGGGKSAGGGILNTITGNPGEAAFNSLPFLYSLYEANRQGNQVDPILARVSGLADTAASNTNGLVASAVDPYDRQTMYGRDALMSDQSLRGVRGSSFGDQGITNYDTTRGMGRADIVGSTTAKSLGLQGGLLDSLLKGTTNAATSRNLLIGAGLSASGKLFQPQTDPFGLASLLALGGSNP